MMTTAEAVQQLKEKLAHAIITEVTFHGETTLEVHKDNLIEVLTFLKQAPGPGYEVLMDLTGVDYLEPVKRTKAVYWLHNPENFSRVRITVFAGRGEILPSVVPLWEGANWYERELFDLFGLKFEGHPDLKRLLMPDDWIGHPLLRDYALTEEAVEFKHGVIPKVPSQIIPGVKRNHLNILGTYDQSNRHS